MQEVTEGLVEDFSELDQQLHEGLIKPKVLPLQQMTLIM